MRIVTVSEMIDIEQKANSQGLSYEEMMRNAGAAVAQVVLKRYARVPQKCVIGLIGSGNNGGDTLIALEEMQASGWQAIALLAKERPDDDGLIKDLKESGGIVLLWDQEGTEQALIHAMRKCSIVLDGILGTGFKLPLRGSIPELLSTVRKHARNCAIVAVDCPSGVDCDSGECAPETLRAEITICMAAVKQGLLKMPALGLVGEIIYGDIGLPEELFQVLENGLWVAEQISVSAVIPGRSADAHKGTFGKCMVIGGSIQYPGAPLLAAGAAYHTGAGLVCTGVPAAIYDGLIGCLPESIWLMLPHEMGFLNADAAKIVAEEQERYDAMLLGPGLGSDKVTKDFLEVFLEPGRKSLASESIGFKAAGIEPLVEHHTQSSMVIDADALRALAEIENWQKKIIKTAILTPHPGEMAALTGSPVQEIQQDRLLVARRFAEERGHVVVLKGAGTVIAGPDGRQAIVPIATPALATAGSGDVLAGMITALLAAGAEPFQAAVAGAWVHGMAGLACERKFGHQVPVTASDIIARISEVLKEITAH